MHNVPFLAHWYISCEVVPGISDHDAVLTTIDAKPNHFRPNKRYVYLYNKGDMQSIKSDPNKLSDEIVRDYQTKSVNDLFE